MHLGTVQRVTAFDGNLIMMNLEMEIFIEVFDWTMTNLHDQPPDGEGEGKPDGDGVYHQCEVGVEEHEDSPRERVLKFKLDSISQKTLSRFCNSQSQC